MGSGHHADGGKRRYVYDKTRAEVAGKLRRAQQALADGLPLTGGRTTVGQLLAAWLNDAVRPSLRRSTFESYQLICERLLTPAMRGHRLDRLTADAVQRYLNAKLEDGYSARTVQYHHAVLRRTLGQAERWGLVARNVARLVTPPRVERDEVRPLTAAQARRFLDAARGDRLEGRYALAMATGLRQGELLALAWPDVDLDLGTLTVKHSLQRFDGESQLVAPKTRTSRRTLSLAAVVCAALRAHRVRQLQERLTAGSAWDGDDWELGVHDAARAPAERHVRYAQLPEDAGGRRVASPAVPRPEARDGHAYAGRGRPPESGAVHSRPLRHCGYGQHVLPRAA